MIFLDKNTYVILEIKQFRLVYPAIIVLKNILHFNKNAK